MSSFRLVNFTFADLGRHHQATMCHWGPYQDGAVCAKTQAKAKVVDSYIPYACSNVSSVQYILVWIIGVIIMVI